MKYPEVLKFYIVNPNWNLQIGKVLQQKDNPKTLKTEMTLFHPNWQGTKFSINYSHLLNYFRTAENYKYVQNVWLLLRVSRPSWSLLEFRRYIIRCLLEIQRTARYNQNAAIPKRSILRDLRPSEQ